MWTKLVGNKLKLLLQKENGSLVTTSAPDYSKTTVLNDLELRNTDILRIDALMKKHNLFVLYTNLDTDITITLYVEVDDVSYVEWNGTRFNRLHYVIKQEDIVPNSKINLNSLFPILDSTAIEKVRFRLQTPTPATTGRVKIVQYGG